MDNNISTLPLIPIENFKINIRKLISDYNKQTKCNITEITIDYFNFTEIIGIKIKMKA